MPAQDTLRNPFSVEKIHPDLGKLPTPAEYLAAYKEKVAPKKEPVYKYLRFDEMAGYGK